LLNRIFLQTNLDITSYALHDDSNGHPHTHTPYSLSLTMEKVPFEPKLMGEKKT